jgi:hypothetical protein
MPEISLSYGVDLGNGQAMQQMPSCDPGEERAEETLKLLG